MRRASMQILLVLLGAAAVSAWALTSAERSTVAILMTVAMYVAMTSGWIVLGGYGGYLNLGTAGFFGIGAYVTAMVSQTTGFQPFLTLAAGAVVAAVVALLIGAPTLRLRGPYFAIMTLLLTFIVGLVTQNFGIFRGAIGFRVPRPDLDAAGTLRYTFLFYLGLAVLTLIGMVLFHRSTFAHRLRAIREDEDAAEILGVHTARTKIVAFMIGSAVAGACGSVWAWQVGFVEPVNAFNLLYSVNVLLMAIIGGSRAWYGGLVGAPLLLALENFLRTTAVRLELFGPVVPTEFNRAVLGFLIVLIAIFFRRGIAGLFERRVGRAVI